jgi:hypothetical protein
MRSHLLIRLVRVLFPAFFVLAGCRVPVYDADIQFVDRLVINGMIVPGQQITGIYVGKMLPVTTAPDPADAEVHDAAVTITIDGQAFPLIHAGSGLYGNSTIVAVPGKTYGLTVEWNGLKVTAQTLVPFVPDSSAITFTRMAEQLGQVSSIVTAHPSEVYGLTLIHGYRRTVFDILEHDYVPVQRLVRAIEEGPDGKIDLVSGEIYLAPNETSDTLWVTVSALDDQFYKYYYSSGNTSDFENLVLGVPPGSPNWNVSGDGVGLCYVQSQALDPQGK